LKFSGDGLGLFTIDSNDDIAYVNLAGLRCWTIWCHGANCKTSIAESRNRSDVKAYDIPKKNHRKIGFELSKSRLNVAWMDGELGYREQHSDNTRI
jgi:hypothetical protein